MSAHDVLTLPSATVDRAARGLTRRRLIRRGGGAAIGVALGSRVLMWGTPPARANGTPGSPCGPSPLCPGSNCWNGQCSNCAGRVYNTFTCAPGQPGGCWVENYCGTGQGKWQCCDCCCFNGTGSVCSSCGDSHTRKACLCRKQLSC